MISQIQCCQILSVYVCLLSFTIDLYSVNPLLEPKVELAYWLWKEVGKQTCIQSLDLWISMNFVPKGAIIDDIQRKWSIFLHPLPIPQIHNHPN